MFGLSPAWHTDCSTWGMMTGKAKILLLLSFLIPALVQAVPGDLDTSYFGNGISTTFIASEDVAQAMAIQPDGKIVVAGKTVQGSDSQFALARYNVDGTLDTSFDTDGIVTTTITNGESNGEARAVDAYMTSEGVIKIVAVGSAGSMFGVARYNEDGSLDDSFHSSGQNGTRRCDFDSINNEVATAVVVQPNEMIVVAGHGDTSGGRKKYAVARLKKNGNYDTANFDGISGDGEPAGKAVFGFAVSGDSLANLNDMWVTAVGLQSTGKIIVSGYGNLESNSNNYRFFAAGLGTDGSLDWRKMSHWDGTSTDKAYDMLIQSDDKILLAGRFGNYFGLARFNANGSRDSSFGGSCDSGGGCVRTNIPGFTPDVARGVAIMEDEEGEPKIIVVGSSGTTGVSSPVEKIDNALRLLRLNMDGSRDTTFRGEGKSTIAFPDFTDVRMIGGVVVDAENRIFVAGNADGQFAVARLFGESAADLEMDFEAPSADPALVEEQTTYKFFVTNHGPDNNPGVVAIFELSESAVLDATTPDVSCMGESTITCDLGVVTVGETVTIEITVTPIVEGEVIINASVSGELLDVDSTNNQKTLTDNSDSAVEEECMGEECEEGDPDPTDETKEECATVEAMQIMAEGGAVAGLIPCEPEADLSDPREGPQAGGSGGCSLTASHRGSSFPLIAMFALLSPLFVLRRRQFPRR